MHRPNNELSPVHQKLGQSDLLYWSKLPANKNGREYEFLSRLSLTAHEMLVNSGH